MAQGGLADPQRTFKCPTVNIRTDSTGNIIYPIEVTGTLKVLNLGQIEYSRPAFHTHSNIFPIGYVAIREHASMYQIGQKASYQCEVIDDGSKPVFKVTCSEAPHNPVERDTASGAWLEFVKKINQLQQTRKAKPSVSGPDRFGLSEAGVLKILQNMPNADKLKNYKTKHFV